MQQVAENPPADQTKQSSRSARAGGVAVDQLKSIIGRVERLEEERGVIARDIRDVFSEAKGNGFDVKTIRKIIALRKMDAQEREEAEVMLDTYLRALGMQLDMFDDEEPEDPTQKDPLYKTAVEIVRRDNKPSTSYLQRCMTIGYNRAADLIEAMERSGVVSAANHVGKRTVLNSTREDATISAG